MNTLKFGKILAVASLASLPSMLPAVDVDLELSLLVDVSDSVETSNFNLQRDGYAAAFRSSAVQSAISNGALGQIAVNYIYWSGPGEQQETVGWTLLDSPAAADAFANSIQGAARPFAGVTALADAIDFATPLFDTNGFDSARQVIDISADGADSDSVMDLATVRASAATTVEAINAVAIEDPALVAYFSDEVVVGDTGFVLFADNFDDFLAAIESKILGEIMGGTGSFVQGLTPLQQAIADNFQEIAPLATDELMDLIIAVNSQTGAEQLTALERAGHSFLSTYADAGFRVASFHNEHLGNRLNGLRGGTDMRKVLGQEAGGNTFGLGENTTGHVLVGGDFSDFDASTNQIDADYDTFVFLGAVDFHINDSTLLGIGYSYNEGESNVGDGRGKLDLNGNSVSLYTSHTFAESAYFDLVGTYTWLDYESTRNVSVGSFAGSGRSDTTGSEYSILGRVGFDWQYKNFLIGPIAEVQYIDLSIDSFSESGLGTASMNVGDQDTDSLTVAGGFRAAYHHKTPNGYVLPNIHAMVVNQLDDDAHSVTTSYAGTPGIPFSTPIDDSDGTFFRVGAGLSFVVTEKITVGAALEATLGNRDYDQHSASLFVTIPIGRR